MYVVMEAVSLWVHETHYPTFSGAGPSVAERTGAAKAGSGGTTVKGAERGF